MRKINALMVCFFLPPLFLHAQIREDVFWVGGDTPKTADADIEWKANRHTSDGELVWAEEEEEIVEVEEIEEEIKAPFRVKPRIFELGLMNTNAGFANDFLSAGEIFQKMLVIDIDKLDKGFRINLNADIYPVYLSLNIKDKWGIGLSTKLDVTGLVGLSGNMLSFSEAVDDKSDVAGAAFVEASPNAFFHVKKFKVKVKPAMYYPLLYVKPEISYTNKITTTDEGTGTVFKLGYDLQIYTAMLMDENFSFSDFSFNSITASPGFDLSMGAEYPLSKELGLSEKSELLDFDVGLDLINIPIVPSSMVNYMRMSGQLGGDDPIDFFAGDVFKDFFNVEETVSGEAKTRVLRPFKMLAWALWRPFEKKVFTFIPSLGFAINPIYVKPFSLEGGITARMDLANLFIATLGINYNDRIWRNGFNLAFNFRLYEINIGVDVRSPGFLKSFTGAGVGVTFGVKLGF